MPAGKRGLPPDSHVSVESGSMCARSSRHASSCSSGALRGRADRRAAVVPEHRHADGAVVEAERVCTDDRLVDAAVPALEHLPVLVDEEVVADVVPAVALHVVQLDAAHDRRRLRRGVVVRAGRVMHDGEVDRRGDLRIRATDRLVGAPRETRDDRRCVRDRESARRRALRRAPDVVRAQPRDASVRAEPNRVRRAGPHGASETPGSDAVLAARCVGTDVVVGRLPCAPGAGARPRPELDRTRAAPVNGDHVEPRRRGGERPSRLHEAAPSRRQGRHGRRRPRRGKGGGRRGERRDDRDEECLHGRVGPGARVATARFGGKVERPFQIESLRLWMGAPFVLSSPRRGS